MVVSTILSRRSKHLRRCHADRRRQTRVNEVTERRKTGGRRETDIDTPNFAYHGT